MKIYAPEYYEKFSCIANRCKHSCCIGWEIDIDEKTLDTYMKTKGDFGERLKRNISKGEESCFILGEGERCPFLNENNLCDIYSELGEENLCQICSDHPRFRNLFDSRTEIGLGLCCEAAADLILEWDKPFALVVVGEDDKEELFDDEMVFFSLREKAFEIIRDEELDVVDCIEELFVMFDIDFPVKIFGEWIDIFLSLEILDPKWKEILESAKKSRNFDNKFLTGREAQRAQRRLLEYFLFRHTADGIYDGTFGARLAFAVLSLEMIKALCATSENPSLEVFEDIARRYSAEIEYCEENVERLICVLSKNN